MRPVGRTSTGRVRLPAIDHLKAAAIVAVVFTHSARLGLKGPVTPWDLVLAGMWVPYHVPTFLFVSGFLYAGRDAGRDAGREPLERSRLLARLSRVLLPYLVASLLVQASGTSGAGSLREAAFQLATASAVGSYYYVALIVCCIFVAWPLSRAPEGAVAVLWAALLAYGLAAWLEPSLSISRGVFWSLRNPLQHFFLAYFVAGWGAALLLPRSIDTIRRRRKELIALSGGAVLFGVLVYGQQLGLRPSPVVRLVYSFGVIGGIALLTAPRAPGATVRLLSEASLAIYLFHRMFQLCTQSLVEDWHPAARILTQAAVGLVGGGLLAWGGRRVLGAPRARAWLGA